jgi:hypothetical protein
MLGKGRACCAKSIATYGNGNPKLKVYLTVILQLTTIGLLLSFSSSAATILPAMLEVPTTVETEVKAEDYMPITDSKNIEKFVNDYFADIPIMTEIAKCESQFRHLNSKGDVLKGDRDKRDTGVMQINLFYHEKTLDKLGLNVHDLDDNVRYARYLYEKEGAKPWMSSSACWAKFSRTEIAKR